MVDGDAKNSVLSEFLRFLTKDKKWWLVPLITVLVVMGVLALLGDGSSTAAPFEYPSF